MDNEISDRSREVMLSDGTYQSPLEDIEIPTDVALHEYIFKACDRFKDMSALVGLFLLNHLINLTNLNITKQTKNISSHRNQNPIWLRVVNTIVCLNERSHCSIFRVLKNIILKKSDL